MKRKGGNLLLALRHSDAMASFDLSDWDLVVRQAIAAGLLGRLGAAAKQVGIMGRLPEPVTRHMQAALTLAEQQRRAVLWELTLLSKTLSKVQGPIVLLKGAAYAAADLPPGAGRLFSDIDILVLKTQLAETESALMLGGWNSSHHDSYDQRYYREWMHELPPMVHIRRNTVLDLHHNILPETARIRTHPGLILAAARPLRDFPRFSVPSTEDQVLHSATHLFHEGEWEHGLRDLSDLDTLIRAYSQNPSFWINLTERARKLSLGKPLFYGLRYCQWLLQTPMPTDILERCPDAPGWFGRATMDLLFLPAFSTAHHSIRSRFSAIAVFCLYVRSHWLRMPAYLLIPHLLRKSWKRRLEKLFKKSDSVTSVDNTP